MESSNNRTQILQSALTRFATRGYDATGVQEIVGAVGIGKPTLYHYFGSKLGLLDALLTEYTAPFFEELRNATRYERNLPVTLDRVVAVYLSFAAEQPAFYRFLLSLLFVPPEHEARAAAARVVGEQLRLLEGMFEAAARDHGNMRGRHARYAYSFLGVLNGYALLVLNGHVKPNARLRYDIVHQFSHGIYS